MQYLVVALTSLEPRSDAVMAQLESLATSVSATNRGNRASIFVPCV